MTICRPFSGQHRRFVVGLAAASVAIGCGPAAPDPVRAAATQAITSGTADLADPAVARLSGGLASCTGTLVSATVILTAAHCMGPPAPTQAWFGAAMVDGEPGIPMARLEIHPDFDSLRLDHDVAMVALQSAPGVAPVPLWPGPQGAEIDGAALRVVGFGRDAIEDVDTSTKRTGTARIAAVTDTRLGLAPDPSLPCIGDSGGPALFASGGREWLAGVTSGGDARCQTMAEATRVDVYTASFIQPFIDDAESAAGSSGCGVGHGQRAGAWLFAIAAGALAARSRRGHRHRQESPWI